MPYWFEPKTVSLEVGGRTLTLETGRMAKQASSVVVSYDNTVVLVTATTTKGREGQNFLPLTVDFVEKTSAAGKIPGGFFKREARLSDREILVCRFIDRSIRPLFADGFRDEVQVVATVLAADGKTQPDIAAFYGASAALHISKLPFAGPIAAVRVGRVDGEWITNPVAETLKESDIELVVAGSEKALVMVEGGAQEATEAEILEALKYGHQEIQPIIQAQEELRNIAGVEKMDPPAPADLGDLGDKLRSAAEAELREATRIQTKKERYAAIDEVESKAVAEVVDAYRNEPADLSTLAKVEERQAGLRNLQGNAKDFLHDLRSELMRDRLLSDGVRIDGRATTDVRQIACEIRPVPRAHGVSLFTRGETQALVYATLGSEDDAQTIDALTERSQKHFLLHYNFPPFSVGEVKFLRGPSRRDVGHGNLAERAIAAVMPDKEDFPYTVRVVSEVLESNGSSSMATICGATLSLMDAGVPLKAPVAGIAMGLVEGGDRRAILSDILGDEDHLGDMDFKVAGTERGINALQMDIKIDGITREIMEIALGQAKEGRLHILGEMNKAIKAPREQMSEHAPRIVSFKIHPDKIRDVIGKGGATIRSITEETGATVDISDDGTVKIFSVDKSAGDEARKRVELITAEVEVGAIYEGRVARLMDFGAFVTILPGKDGLVHISQISDERVEKVSDKLSEGDTIKVKVLEVDKQGRIRLSMKAVAEEAEA